MGDGRGRLEYPGVDEADYMVNHALSDLLFVGLFLWLRVSVVPIVYCLPTIVTWALGSSNVRSTGCSSYRQVPRVPR